MRISARPLTFILVVMMLIIPARTLFAADSKFDNETLHYVIAYKWGLIHKETGTATLTLKNVGENYNITLTARTKPWADKIFQVRDTLLSTVSRKNFKPLSYTKIAHEGGKYSRDAIKYTYMSGHTYGHATRIRKDKKGKISSSSKQLSASESAYDMLSIFYYLRSIDYSTIPSGKKFSTTIFSGKKKETLTIRCLGIEKINTRNKKNVPAYHIRFRFTSENGQKSSDDMDTWISTDNTRIPLRLEGNLPVGKVKCYLAD